MRVVVDFDVCESNAICVGLVPSVFEIDENEYLSVVEEPDESLLPDLEKAVRACPKQAIKLIR
ncbi:MAG: ferredoxin [Frankia sp.]|nr:ferredoxin [Frankia sp.]